MIGYTRLSLPSGLMVCTLAGRLLEPVRAYATEAEAAEAANAMARKRRRRYVGYIKF